VVSLSDTLTVSAPGTRQRATPLTTAMLGTAILLGMVLLMALQFPGRPEWFVSFGGQGNYTPYARDVLGEDVMVTLADGHDGQAFWLQARDPALLQSEATADVFDRPVYRAQRMLYPTLAAPFRLAGDEALLWGLVLVNLAVVAGGTYVSARLAVNRGAPAILGLAFALNPLVLVAALMDLGDALGLALLMATVLALREDRFRTALLCAVGAVLAKEVFLLPLGAIALLSIDGLSWRRRAELLVLPALSAGLWGLYVRWRFDWAPTKVGELTPVPLKGFVDAYRVEWSVVHDWIHAIVAVALLALSAMVVVRWCRRRTLELTAALPFALLVPMLSLGVISLWMNSIRAFGPAITLLAIDWYATSDHRRSAVARRDEAREARGLLPT
jgi:hypothetical protein